MRFTALHRAVGRPPGDLGPELLNEAIAAAVRESRELDWKSSLPPRSGVAATDFPKEVAAMRNTGDGVIVYGVSESGKVATGRNDTGPMTESHERTLCSAAATAITPPIFDLRFDTLTFSNGTHAVVLEILQGIDGPHMISRMDFFGAPIRNDADTVWMTEREIEAAYRARFTERDNAAVTLLRLCDDDVLNIGDQPTIGRSVPSSGPAPACTSHQGPGAHDLHRRHQVCRVAHRGGPFEYAR